MSAHHPFSRAPQANISVSRYLNSSSREVKDTTIVVGELQELVIAAVLESGLVRFSIRDIILLLEKRKGVRVDRRRAHDALQRLLKRGYVIKLARGFYQALRERMHELYTNGVRLNRSQYRRTKDGEVKDNPINQGASLAARSTTRSMPNYNALGNGGASPASGSATRSTPNRANSAHVSAYLANGGDSDNLFGQVFYDNVRGWLLGGGWAPGDRGAFLTSEDLVRFKSVSYAEFRVFSRTSVSLLDHGYFVFYRDSKTGLPVLEFRPYSNFVKRYGIAHVERAFREGLIEAWLALSSVVADLHGRGSLVKLLKRLLRGWWPEFRALLSEFMRDVLGGLSWRELAGALCLGGGAPL